MRRFLLSLLLSVSFFQLKAAIITWVGVSGSNWNNTANWFPASVPVAGDDVIFNGFSGTVEMDILTTTNYLINSLLISGNSLVTLVKTLNSAGGVTRNLVLTSTSSVNPGLKIELGSSLTIESLKSGTGFLNYNLSLTGSTGTTGEVFGTLLFKGTSTLDNAGMNLYAGVSNNADLKVKSAGVIKFLAETGNTTSSATGTYLTMEGGSSYIIEKNGGTFPSGGLWDANSLAKVTNLSGASCPSFNGNSYGNLEWNCPAQTSTLTNFLNQNISFNNVNLINTNSGNINGELKIAAGASALSHTMTVGGGLTIGANSRLNITSSSVTSPNGARLVVKGNIINSGTLTSNGVLGTINELELNGVTNQGITNSGTFSGVRLLFIMNNSAGATLNSALTLPYNLTLTNGKIATTATNLLTMIDNATYAGGSATSFIEGPIKKIGNDNFIFPIGAGQIYAPIGITNSTGESPLDEFTAEYIRTNPQSVYGFSYGSGINHISYVEYWTLDRSIGSSAEKFVTLDAHRTSFVLDPSATSTFVSKYDGSTWNKIASTAALALCPASLYQCGTVTTTSPVTSFSPFTLATDQPFSANPLPIKLIGFDAAKTNTNTAVINWQLAACCSKQASFELLKSKDGNNYTCIANIAGSETNISYIHTDDKLSSGITYYRLKGIDADGKISYSRIVAVINDAGGLVITSLFPNPLKDEINIAISVAKPAGVVISVYNLSGNKLLQWNHALSSGNNVVAKNISGLKAGIYQIVITGSTGKRLVKGFIKE